MLQRFARPWRLNLDAVRLLLALNVCIYHLGLLTGATAYPPFVRPDLAVSAFFVLSGLLIFASLDRRPSIADFYARRLRRIYPAYAVVILASGLLLAPTIWDFFRYVGPNLLFLNFLAPTIPGVFEGNDVTFVNGALWTLKIEVAFYLIAPLIALACRRYGTVTVLGGLAAASLAYAVIMAGIVPQLAYQLPGQLYYFAAGGLAFHWLRSTGRELPRNRWGTDISYSLYVVHFPVFQGLIAAGLPQRLGAGFMPAALAAIAIASFLLWYLVEAPALRMGVGRRRAPAPA